MTASSQPDASATPATDLFLRLTPERVLAAVEVGGIPCNNLCYPLNSFENRVYEVELVDGARLVAKFYRPGRWSRSQILEEHRFLIELAQDELPVCAVQAFPDGGTLRSIDGIHFCLAPRRGGRAPDELTPALASRLGRLVGRMHAVGARSGFESGGARRPIDADAFVRRPLRWLRRHGDVAPRLLDRFQRAADRLADLADRLLERVETQRVHADLHLGNVLLRDDRLRLLDFDDMTRAPAVQDLWLAVPGRDQHSLRLRDALLDGYEEFRLFDPEQLRLIEALRGLRIVRYAVWLARRWHDPAFRRGWPQFGSDEYWLGEAGDLEEQVRRVRSDHDHWRGPARRRRHLSAPAEPTDAELTNKDYFWDWEDGG